MSDLNRYQQQFDSLELVLGQMKALYEGIPAGGLHRQNTILHLIDGLQVFAKGQFNFFFKGFTRTGGAVYPRLSPAVSATNSRVDYPSEHVLANTLAQIAKDITLIQLAAEQRRFPMPLPFGNAGNFLNATDRLAATALWPKSNGYLDGTPRTEDTNPSDCSYNGDMEFKAVLTYFSDSVSVRMMPYSQVALIGIPYGALMDLRSLLSIPHEVGHFRYWYSYRQKAPPAGKSPHLTNKWMNVRELFYPFNDPPKPPTWGEEVFADVYAALFGGPLAVLTAEDLAMEHSARVFTEFDSKSDHPVPFLRPLILIKALSNFGPKLLDPALDAERDRLTLQLFNRWQRRLDTDRFLATFNDPDPAHLQNEDLFELKFDLIDPPGIVTSLATSIQNSIKWSRALDTNLPIDAMIQKALDALENIFETTGALPRDWGWSQATTANPWGTVAELEQVIEGLLLEHLINAGQVGEFSDSTLARLKGECKDLPQAPAIWSEWVQKNGKGYFDTIQPTATYYAGDYNTDMNPIPPGNPTPPPSINKWIRVYGAGGWTTEGPCHLPPG